MPDPERIDNLLPLKDILSQDEISKRQNEVKLLLRKIDNLEFLASIELELCIQGKDINRLLEICNDTMISKREVLNLLPVAIETKDIRNEISEGLRNIIKFYNTIKIHGRNVLQDFIYGQ